MAKRVLAVESLTEQLTRLVYDSAPPAVLDPQNDAREPMLVLWRETVVAVTEACQTVERLANLARQRADMPPSPLAALWSADGEPEQDATGHSNGDVEIGGDAESILEPTAANRPETA